MPSLLTTAVLAFLLLGHYTEKARVSGVLVRSGANVEANLYVPGRFIRALKPGTQIVVSCSECPDPRTQQSSGAVAAIVAANPNSMTESRASSTANYLVTVSLLPLKGSDLPAGLRVEADLTLERRPLLKWMFERPRS